MSARRRPPLLHRIAFFWMGNLQTWVQHKATCVPCGGTPFYTREVD